MRSLEAQVDVCRRARPQSPQSAWPAGTPSADFIVTHLTDLSRHFSKTAQSDGSGAQVGRPRTPSSDSNPVLTSQGTKGAIQIRRRAQY